MHLEWKDSYRIGEPQIDRQHQELFAIAKLVIGASDQPAFRLAAMDLYRYIRKHFTDEEFLMREVNYPYFRAHAQLHNELIARFNELSRDFGKGQWNRNSIEDFMSQWLLQHIGEADARIAAFIQTRTPIEKHHG